MKVYGIVAIIIILIIVLLYVNLAYESKSVHYAEQYEYNPYVYGAAVSNGISTVVNENSVSTSESPVQCLDASGESHNCTLRELIDMGFVEVNKSNTK